jgi:hypothetical protein
VSKGLSTEAGVFDTTSAGSSLVNTTIAGVFQVLGLLCEALGDVRVPELRATVLASTVVSWLQSCESSKVRCLRISRLWDLGVSAFRTSGLSNVRTVGITDVETRDIIFLDLGASDLRELHDFEPAERSFGTI